MITRAHFVANLLSAVPEVDGMVREHLDAYEGELLLHLLMADLVRHGVAAFEDGRSSEARRLLEFVDSCLAEGDEYITNAVLVSFIENYGYGEDEPDSFLAIWPDGLRAGLGL